MNAVNLNIAFMDTCVSAKRLHYNAPWQENVLNNGIMKISCYFNMIHYASKLIRRM